MQTPTAIVVLLLSGGAPGLVWAQVVTENAGTVSPETPAWQTRFEYVKSERVTDQRMVETFLWAPNEVMDFGPSVPLHQREVAFAGLDDTPEGVGDASTRWKYSVWKRGRGHGLDPILDNRRRQDSYRAMARPGFRNGGRSSSSARGAGRSMAGRSSPIFRTDTASRSKSSVAPRSSGTTSGSSPRFR